MNGDWEDLFPDYPEEGDRIMAQFDHEFLLGRLLHEFWHTGEEDITVKIADVEILRHWLVELGEKPDKGYKSK